MGFFFNKIIISVIFTTIFIIQPILLFTNIPKVNASVPVVEVGKNLIVNTLTAKSTTVTAGNTTSLVAKEFAFDSVAYVVAKVILHELTGSIVNWINSGFDDGGPGFVTDFGGFLSDIVDVEIGRFIEGSELAFLCSPYEIDIKVALKLPLITPFDERISCTFSDAIDNLEGFIGGDFSQEGWEGWFELTTKPQNNIYGAYLASEKELNLRIAAKQYRETTQLDWGSGFLSWTECVPFTDPNTGEELCSEEIVTPGSIIEDQLANVLGSGVRQLELADELNEIVIALVSQLINQAMGGLHGLRGANESIGGKAPLVEQLAGAANEVLQNAKDDFIILIDAEIKGEIKYLNIKKDTLNALVASEGLLLKLEECYLGKLGLSPEEVIIAKQIIKEAIDTWNNQIVPIKTSVINDIASVEDFIDILLLGRAEILIATASELEALSEVYINAKQNGEFHGDSLSIFNAQEEQKDVIAQMSALNITTNQQIVECQAFPSL